MNRLATASRFGRRLIATVLATSAVLAGCAQREDSPLVRPKVASTQGLTFEQWKETVRFQGSKDIYAVGDRFTPLGLKGDEEARFYFDHYVDQANALTLHNGQQKPGDPWVGSYFKEQATLHYCIDKAGWDEVQDHIEDLPAGENIYEAVVEAFGNAASAWNVISGLKISYDGARDTSCSPRDNDNITWYVTPLSQTGTIQYLAFVLRPDLNIKGGPEARNFYLWDQIPAQFALHDTFFSDKFTIEGLLAHTIGLGLGFIGEQNRTDSEDGKAALWPAKCREPDVGGIYLTAPDAYSVMTHPKSMASMVPDPDCTGYRKYDYAITYLDAFGAACQYLGAHGLYFCNDGPQQVVAKMNIGKDCSPVPIFPGAAGDCGATVNYAAPAAQYEAALIQAVMR